MHFPRRGLKMVLLVLVLLGDAALKNLRSPKVTKASTVYVHYTAVPFVKEKTRAA